MSCSSTVAQPPAARYRLPLGAVELRATRREFAAGIAHRSWCRFGRNRRSPTARSVRTSTDAPLAIDFTGDVNPGRLLQGSKAVADPRDFSAVLFLAYTKDDLFIAVRVQDDKLAISPTAVHPAW